ncbi:hypothetical protein PVK06_011523 [Gossypium arboreum]|uniref:Uncharacterized protein n=1 Tax=Gossypium arboreum TaxID=29729 RepID=A0ABR0Q958_GOSAR|nr:hypothetical protein PVK06_011523 [Gossypium arboreum]
MGGGFRVLHLVRPFLSFLPEVQSADRKILLERRSSALSSPSSSFWCAVSFHYMEYTLRQVLILSIGCVLSLHQTVELLWNLVLPPL